MTTKHLTIGKSGFALPLDAVTTAIGVLGIRGSGKTHTAGVVAEEMLSIGAHVVVLDPVGVWWGLRSSADGTKPGFPVVILGGDHADVPLEPTSGSVVADFVVDSHASVVLTTREFSKSEQRRFVGDFCERLYRRKGAPDQRHPIHVVIDEADEFAPQRLPKGPDLKCFGAVDTLVRRGRSSGIGVTLISQRSAAINKDVLTQIELLIAHRVISPPDRKAIESWLEAHPVGDTAKKAAVSLASLAKGECWVWSPSWLKSFERITVRQRKTFDSSATPKSGDAKSGPKRLAEVDLESLRASMSESMQKAEANDPAKLKKRIAELEKENRAMRENPLKEVADHSQCRDNEIAMSEENDRLRALLIDARNTLERIRETASVHNEIPTRFQPTISATSTKRSPARPVQISDFSGKVKSVHDNGNGSKLPEAQTKILTALAQYPSGRTRSQVAMLAGYSHTSGGFGQNIADMRKDGLIEGSAQCIRITAKGQAALGDFEPLPTGDELIEYWANRMGGGAGRILRYVASCHPRLVGREDVAAATDHSPTSGGFGQSLADLRKLGLISRGREFTLSDEVLT